MYAPTVRYTRSPSATIWIAHGTVIRHDYLLRLIIPASSLSTTYFSKYSKSGPSCVCATTLQPQRLGKSYHERQSIHHGLPPDTKAIGHRIEIDGLEGDERSSPHVFTYCTCSTHLVQSVSQSGGAKQSSTLMQQVFPLLYCTCCSIIPVRLRRSPVQQTAHDEFPHDQFAPV